MDTNDTSQDLGSAFLTNDAQFIVQSDGDHIWNVFEKFDFNKNSSYRRK